MWVGVIVLVLLAVSLVIRFFSREKRMIVQIQWHMAQGRTDRALPLVRRQLDHLRRTKGDNDLNTAVAKYTLGQIEYEHGRTEEGRRLVNEATAFFVAYSGPHDDAYGVYLLNLAIAQRAIDRRDQAIQTFRQVVDLHRQLHGPDADSVAQALSNLGATLQEAGRAEESISIYEDALRIRTALRGAESVEVARVRNNLANANISLQQWGPAERNIQQAIAVLQRLPTQELGQAYDTYAKLLEEQEKLAEAEEMRTKALTALKHALGESNAEVAKQMEKYAALLERLNRRTECDLFKRKAAAVRETLV